MERVIICMIAVILTGYVVRFLAKAVIRKRLQVEALQGQVCRADNSTAKASIQHAIDKYQAEKGYYPSSLDALVPGWLPRLPKRDDGSDYPYDPFMGHLLESASSGLFRPPPPTPGDMQRLQQIQAAAARYAEEKSAYPPSLQSLVPKYMISLPKTDAGRDFDYDSRTGVVVHPSLYMGDEDMRRRMAENAKRIEQLRQKAIEDLYR